MVVIVSNFLSSFWQSSHLSTVFVIYRDKKFTIKNNCCFCKVLGSVRGFQLRLDCVCIVYTASYWNKIPHTETWWKYVFTLNLDSFEVLLYSAYQQMIFLTNKYCTVMHLNQGGRILRRDITFWYRKSV